MCLLLCVVWTGEGEDQGGGCYVKQERKTCEKMDKDPCSLKTKFRMILKAVRLWNKNYFKGEING